MDLIIEKLSKTLDLSQYDTHKPWALINISEAHLNLAAQIISKVLGAPISIEVYDSSNDVVSSKGVEITKGGMFSPDILSNLGYVKVSRVWEQGEYSVMGDTISVWPKGIDSVIRIALFGNDIEQISLLDPQTRILIKNINELTLDPFSKSLREVYGEYLGKKMYFFRDVDLENGNYEYVDLKIRNFVGTSRMHLPKIIESYKKQGYEIYGVTSEEEVGVEDVKMLSGNLPRGFVSSISKLVVLGDLELVGKIDLAQGEGSKKGEEIFKEITPGDYVVHEDHGIGIFERVVEQLGVLYLDVHYAGNDRLLIPLKSADKISKYVGAGKNKPALTGLNSGVWTRIKRKAREDIQRIAKELVGLYAVRSVTKASKIVNSQGDIEALNEFVSKFEYQDTEDQSVITQQIVEDFAKGMPMDRLIVGDVGFGKTELAARAIFLTVNAGFQATLLTPTTILAQQHFEVLKKRFADYPFRIEMLSRFVRKKQREEIIQDINSGKVDIVVGTHAVLSDSILFKDLQTLVVDEEQRFGVIQKEKIKKKKVSINVLSMTATPIPRTLNMAMSGIRDLSILASVPQGRKSIQNHIGEFNWEEVESGIRKELDRSGQVYFLHNRIIDLHRVKEEIESRIPTARVAIAHGQMGEVGLSKIMKDFANRKYDVLVCSTIIENGLDLPNVNTLIVDDAQRYGLSQLYQIRGRVGRSNLQAYAYIMYLNLSGDSSLRLDAIAESSSLGAGFILSSRDLEIRGAGNILGKSQSGTINAVGYALYTQMLEQSVQNLRG